MQEESKYYTPSLVDFHDGFEYEITNGYSWTKKTFNVKDFNTLFYGELDNAIKQHYVRVKYLDKKDIESFGFTFNSKYNIYHSKNEYSINIQRVNLHLKDQGDTLFFGEIKNKSELKRVLERITAKGRL